KTKSIQETAQALAAELGLTIKNVKPNIGTYLGSSEISYTYELDSAGKDKVDLFASLMGDLSSEYQDAVISANYVEEGSENHNAYEIEFSVKGKSIEDIEKELQELGLEGSTYDFNNNKFTIIISTNNWNEERPKTVEELNEEFDNILKLQNYGYEFKERNAQDSRFLDCASRKEIYRSWLAKSGQQSGKLYYACQKALQIVEAAEKFPILYEGTLKERQNQDELRFKAAKEVGLQWDKSHSKFVGNNEQFSRVENNKYKGYKKARRAQVKKFKRFLKCIDARYVDSSSVAELTDIAIGKILQELDPHSSYTNTRKVANDAAIVFEQLEGSFVGVGIQTMIIRDTIVVKNVNVGGPSEKAGLRPGDRIVKVDDKNVAGIGVDNDVVSEYLRGYKGTSVSLSVARPGKKEIMSFVLVRDKISVNSVDVFYVKDSVGYVKLNKFARSVREEMDSVFAYFNSKNVKHIILDLSDNPGGYTVQAVNLCSRFVEEKTLVGYAEGRKMPRRDYYSKALEPNQVCRSGRLVVIINENSASASEITAGAMQDLDRGVIVGRRSFGKALMQKAFNITDASIVRLTIARCYTPSGRCIQKPYTSVDEYNKDLSNRYNHGEYYHKDSIKVDENLKYSTSKYH
ncbi:MAG: S41 family peptidase, partial [Bacteroidales bacterium]|nr:S41 family peptidase [Bacteroidales bacterium]